MPITFIDYTFSTRLSVADVDRIFRDQIRKPANAMLRLSRVNWRFVSPDEDARAFAPIGPVSELSFAVAAYFLPKTISNATTVALEVLKRSPGGLILLGVKDRRSSRLVHIGHRDNTGAKSRVRNFTNSLASVDSSIRVEERARQLAG
jgi:hypothetical protein